MRFGAVQCRVKHHVRSILVLPRAPYLTSSYRRRHCQRRHHLDVCVKGRLYFGPVLGTLRLSSGAVRCRRGGAVRCGAVRCGAGRCRSVRVASTCVVRTHTAVGLTSTRGGKLRFDGAKPSNAVYFVALRWCGGIKSIVGAVPDEEPAGVCSAVTICVGPSSKSKD